MTWCCHEQWFISYLWGIEILHVTFNHPTRSCLYLTYEELKYVNLAVVNLKVAFVYILPMRNWNHKPIQKLYPFPLCLYLTYEELKYSVMSLIFRSTASFISYLWGIEMQFFPPHRFGKFLFISYLWGIEIEKYFC